MSATAFCVENRVFDPQETLPRPELEALQLDRLRACVQRAGGVPYYREAFARHGVCPEAIKSLADLKRLPLTTKADLREHYPLGFLAVARDRIARLHGSSGTTGKPTFVAYTEADRDLWAGLVARVLVAGGLRPGQRVQLAFGYGLFTGGFGLHYGVEKVGAGVLPAAAGNTQRQVMLLSDVGADAIVCTPSYALTIAEHLREVGIAQGSLPLATGHFGGEPWSEDMRTAIEQELGILAFNNYGLSEVIGPGVSGECAVRDGMHIAEDHFLVECLNPETLEPVAPGERGELVFTTLTKEAMPILRYRTRDIAALNPEPCACGRTGVRMSRVTGRTDDMLIIRGVNVFPSQFEEALLRVEGTTPHYLIELDRVGHRDEVTLRVEVVPSCFSDEMRQMQALRDRLDRAVQAVCGIRATIELAAPNSLERFVGKARRVMDHRGDLC